MKVLFCSSEVAPFAKTGGLADVAGSLPQALGKVGIEVLVVMPKYRGIEYFEKVLSERVTVRFIEHEAYFNRSGLYGNSDGDYADNLDRFTFFSRECLETARRLGFRPDVVHAHDWHTALVPVFLKTRLAADEFFRSSRTLLTIHNLGYQGHFPAVEFGKLGLPLSLFSIEGFEFYGKVNVLKAGLLYADRLSAVSPSYAQEIQTGEFGFGLEGILQKRKKRLTGILNGIDTGMWNPATDTRIAARYQAESMDGKKICKTQLQKRCGLAEEPGVPVFAVVSRLAHQKGLDLLAAAVPELFSQKIQLALLGDGDAHYRNLFAGLEKKYRSQMKTFLGFDVMAAHALYAGANFFLMPSLFEPCGLGQMIGMRYGTVPVVRATGGLKDTVRDAELPGGNGFVFEKESVAELAQVVGRAVKTFTDAEKMKQLIGAGMKADFSWDESAKKYAALYQEMSS